MMASAPMFRIDRVLPLASGGALIEFGGPIGLAVEVPKEWVEQHKPRAGGYIDTENEGYRDPPGAPT